MQSAASLPSSTSRRRQLTALWSDTKSWSIDKICALIVRVHGSFLTLSPPICYFFGANGQAGGGQSGEAAPGNDPGRQDEADFARGCGSPPQAAGTAGPRFR